MTKTSGEHTYELFAETADSEDGESVGVFDDVIFACHTDTAASILKQGMSAIGKDDDDALLASLEIIKQLEKIEYADNVVYLHSDPNLMPKRRRAWASWNCLGNSEKIEAAFGTKKGSQSSNDANKYSGAFEGAESGFGNTKESNNFGEEMLEGVDGRMKAVYVTYWLNRLQNLETANAAGKEIFVSLNPHEPPEASLVHKRTHLAHPQFTPATMEARKALGDKHQGTNGLWFCGAWQGYGFHEDGCRSGFEVATELSGVPLPWAETAKDNDSDSKALMVLPPPDLAASSISTSLTEWISEKLFRDLPVALCKRFILFFMKAAVQQGKLRLRSTLR